MYKKGELSTVMLGVFITVVIAVIVLGVASSFLSSSALDTTRTTNEALAFVGNDSIQWNATLSTYPIAAMVSIVNITNDTITTSCDTDLTTGLVNCTGDLNLTQGGRANYTTFPGGYVSSSMTRLLITYFPIMLALALFVFIGGFIAMKK